MLRGIDFSVRAGEFWAVLGPNGAGKTTLLRACLGLVPVSRGEIRLDGRRLSDWKRKGMARFSAWVPQTFHSAFELTAQELVLLGRSPHLGRWGALGGSDEISAQEAMEEAGIWHLKGRRLDRLSGGERRLVYLARAFAQRPKLLFLDEPTAFVDWRGQVELLERVRKKTREGMAAVAVLHDVNLAEAFADRILLLKDGARVGEGPPKEVLTPSTLEALFEVPISIAQDPSGTRVFAPASRPPSV